MVRKWNQPHRNSLLSNLRGLLLSFQIQSSMHGTVYSRLDDLKCPDLFSLGNNHCTRDQMHHISRRLALFGSGCSPHCLVPERCKFITSLGLWRRVIPPLLISFINSPHLQLLINLWMILTSFPSSWLVLDEYDSLVTSIQTCVDPLSLSLDELYGHFLAL